MSESWLLRAIAYVELNPVKAEMVKNAWDYRWSSVHAHLSGKDIQGIVQVEKLLSLTGQIGKIIYWKLKGIRLKK